MNAAVAQLKFDQIDGSKPAEAMQDTPVGRAAWHRERFQAAVAEFGVPPPCVWLISANVVPSRTFGPLELETKNGLRLFKPMSRVTVTKFWRNASPERITVVGRHRATNRYITCILESRYLFDFRIVLVRSPYIIRQFWQAPAQRLSYGRDKDAAIAVLALLSPVSSALGNTNEA